MTAAPALVWFRNDLRIRDNAALAAAIATGGPVIGVYVLDEVAAGPWAPGGASRWWLHESLAALASALEGIGVPLVLRRGTAEIELATVVCETGAKRIDAHRGYEPWARSQETRAEAALAGAGARLELHPGYVLFEPDSVTTQAGQPFRVFTPYWRTVSKLAVPEPAGIPGKARSTAPRVTGDRLADWRLLPTKPDWAGGLRESWTPGETGALQRLTHFAKNGLSGYRAGRDRPDEPRTSRLSPHLHFGEIAPARAWHEVQTAAAEAGAAARDGLESFLREIGWREFSYNLLWHWPDLPDTTFRPKFGAFPYVEDPPGLAAWQRGLTGFPIVDAGMRELWTTGYMHNRVRMITASFLTKDLRVDWREGERWFWDTLVDADLANNAASWQWVAGCGADAAPYFRIFNPVKQGQTFDPDGRYVRRWVPELARLSNDQIHAPWLVPEMLLAAAGVRLGRTYPQPIVDHATARDRALAAYATIKGQA